MRFVLEAVKERDDLDEEFSLLERKRRWYSYWVYFLVRRWVCSRDADLQGAYPIGRGLSADEAGGRDGDEQVEWIFPGVR